MASRPQLYLDLRFSFYECIRKLFLTVLFNECCAFPSKTVVGKGSCCCAASFHRVPSKHENAHCKKTTRFFVHKETNWSCSVIFLRKHEEFRSVQECREQDPLNCNFYDIIIVTWRSVKKIYKTVRVLLRLQKPSDSCEQLKELQMQISCLGTDM